MGRALRGSVVYCEQNGETSFAVIRMLDHTADVGFELKSSSLEGLFEEARRALLMVMFERPPEKGDEEELVRLSAPDLETLLVRWLNELMFLIQDSGFVPCGAEVRVREGCSLQARLAGVPLDTEEHGWQGEVKSATFHGLAVTSVKGNWRACVILDV